jgi:hypothetical protein
MKVRALFINFIKLEIKIFEPVVKKLKQIIEEMERFIIQQFKVTQNILKMIQKFPDSTNLLVF